MRSTTGSRRAVAFAAAALVGLLLPACGTRLGNSAFVSQQAGTAGDNGGLAAGSAANGGGGSSSGGGLSGGSTAGGGAISGGSSASGGVSGGAGGAGGGGVTSSGGSAAAGSGGSTAAGSGGSTGGGAGGTGGATASKANFASDTGVTATSITIGNITSLSGAFGPDAFGPSLFGLRSYVDAINDQGGINGRKINLVTCDDGSQGTQFLACAQKLVEQQHIFAFIGNNTDASSAGAHYEYSKGVPDVGFPLNNGYYKYPTMFSIYGSPGYPRDGTTVGYKGSTETTVGIQEWFKQNVHISKAAVFYYVIPVSAQAGCFQEQDLKVVGVPTVYEGGGGNGNCTGAGENPAAPAFDEDVINMRGKGVDAVFDAMDVSANSRLCQAMDRQGFTVKAKVSTVEGASQSIGATFSAPCRDSVYVGGSSVSFADTSNPLVQKFRSDYGKYQNGQTLYQWALEGWGIGYEFTQAIQQMGANVTRKGFMSWLNSFPAIPRGYTVGGLFTPISYAPTNFSTPEPSCNTIEQWSDAAKTFSVRAGTNACPVVPWVSTPATPDGS